MKKNPPLIAKYTSAVAPLAPENCRDANRRIGTIGSRRRRSTGTNAAIAIEREDPGHEDDGFAPPAAEALGERDHRAADRDDAEDATGWVERAHGARRVSGGASGTRRATIIAETTNSGTAEREHPPPPERVDEDTTEERPARRRDRRAARPQADRPATLVLGEAGIDEGEADRGHAGGADALDQASGDEHPEGRAAKQITEPAMSTAQLAT